MKKSLCFLLTSILLCSGFGSALQADDAKPWTFWYWMNGAVTREGITADLEAMAEVGLEGCYLMPIYGIDRAPQLGGTIRQGTPEWWQMVDFALHEADRLNLKIGMHICDGFALAGGPWITPAQSMQNVVCSDSIVSIRPRKGQPWSNALLPAAPEGYYEDIAAYAIPLHYQPGDIVRPDTVYSDSPAFSIDDKGRYKSKEACRFHYGFNQPVFVSAMQITTYNNSLQALRMKVYAADAQGELRLLKQIVPPRHGWQNYDAPTTVALPTVQTQHLVFEWTPEGSEKGSEDLDNGKWGPTLKIQQLDLLSSPRVDDWEGKAGRVWRVSSIEQSATSPDRYVPLDQVIRLTPGTVLPRGDWRIVRIGHASTLHENATGGDCKGLECDKFSRRATQCQLDHWFSEAFRRCDSEVAHRVLKYMHVDSWECSCQNWSDSISLPDGGSQTFAQYFARQRGYDLMPYLPLMVGIPMVDCETSERVLRDVRTTIAELVDNEFYPTLVAEARRLGCQLSAESVAPTMVSDGMQHYRHADYPMGEFWLNSPTHDKPNDMLDAISGGHVWGKPIIQAEGFTELRGQFNEVPAQLKALLDKQYCLGINRLFFHVYTLNPDPTKKPGMTLDGIGLFFQRTQPWWTEAHSFVDYITRCQRLLQMGRPVVDLAVYTGHEMPRRSILPDRLAPLPGYHYDSFNYGALTQPVSSPYRPEYKALALPGARKMDPDHQPLSADALAAIDRLRRAGLPIIEGTPTVQQLRSLGIAPDVIAPDSVLYAHRALPDGDIYFVSNQRNRPYDFDIQLRDHHNRDAVLYDALTDTYRPLPVQADGQYRKAYIALDAQGSCFVLFGLRQGTPAPTPTSVLTHIEQPLSVTSPYELTFLDNGLKLISDTLPDWSQHANDSIRYYSGRVRYTFTFRYKPTKADKLTKASKATQADKADNATLADKTHSTRIFLCFTDLHDAATVSLNGIPCGAVWTAPYQVDITDALRRGQNTFTIEVANSWHNAIVGHDSGHDPFPNIWTNAKYRNPDKTLLKAGIGGMVLRIE